MTDPSFLANVEYQSLFKDDQKVKDDIHRLESNFVQFSEKFHASINESTKKLERYDKGIRLLDRKHKNSLKQKDSYLVSIENEKYRLAMLRKDISVVSKDVENQQSESLKILNELNRNSLPNVDANNLRGLQTNINNQIQQVEHDISNVQEINIKYEKQANNKIKLCSDASFSQSQSYLTWLQLWPALQLWLKVEDQAQGRLAKKSDSGLEIEAKALLDLSSNILLLNKKDMLQSYQLPVVAITTTTGINQGVADTTPLPDTPGSTNTLRRVLQEEHTSLLAEATRLEAQRCRLEAQRCQRRKDLSHICNTLSDSYSIAQLLTSHYLTKAVATKSLNPFDMDTTTASRLSPATGTGTNAPQPSIRGILRKEKEKASASVTYQESSNDPLLSHIHERRDELAKRFQSYAKASPPAFLDDDEQLLRQSEQAATKVCLTSPMMTGVLASALTDKTEGDLYHSRPMRVASSICRAVRILQMQLLMLLGEEFEGDSNNNSSDLPERVPTDTAAAAAAAEGAGTIDNMNIIHASSAAPHHQQTTSMTTTTTTTAAAVDGKTKGRLGAHPDPDTDPDTDPDPDPGSISDAPVSVKRSLEERVGAALREYANTLNKVIDISDSGSAATSNAPPSTQMITELAEALETRRLKKSDVLVHKAARVSVTLPVDTLQNKAGGTTTSYPVKSLPLSSLHPSPQEDKQEHPTFTAAEEDKMLLLRLDSYQIGLHSDISGDEDESRGSDDELELTAEQKMAKRLDGVELSDYLLLLLRTCRMGEGRGRPCLVHMSLPIVVPPPPKARPAVAGGGGGISSDINSTASLSVNGGRGGPREDQLRVCVTVRGKNIRGVYEDVEEEFIMTVGTQLLIRALKDGASHGTLQLLKTPRPLMRLPLLVLLLKALRLEKAQDAEIRTFLRLNPVVSPGTGAGTDSRMLSKDIFGDAVLDLYGTDVNQSHADQKYWSTPDTMEVLTLRDAHGELVLVAPATTAFTSYASLASQTDTATSMQSDSDSLSISLHI